ncbi:signal recognition particle-docking protein FtsY [Rhizobium sp. Leaf262]|uniref:signal recognition particle-docking protein FtsY n=1 Tax=Rhizobium sp. Leaf262 TaxID=1736312 RepID=UPI0007132BC5|nr:signal recognition particle-docking protein FtsY [Rhizobium sp. Leaf262]KQO73840.1 signal recognition particle-docking protein FtsY [Rhizobium sp. Leaf262]
MALGFIKKVFSFGKDKAETDKPDADQTPLSTSDHPTTFEEVLSEAEAHAPVADDPVSDIEMDTAGGPAPDDVVDDATINDEDEDAPLLPGTEQVGDIGMVPLSLLQAEAAAEEQPAAALEDVAADAPLDVDAMDDILAEAEAASVEEPSETAVTPAALPKGFASASDRVLAVEPAPEIKLTWFQRLRAGLSRTSSQLTSQISALFTKRKLDEDTLDELEDLLIQSDLGLETAMRITGALSSERYGKDVSGEDVARIMAGEITKVLAPVAKPLELDLSHKPHVILVVGVNGTGKTTTIGKLAAKLSGSGLKVMLAAGDTFRAAAIEQLKIWADRTGSEFIGTKLGADAAGLAYDAFEQARAKKSDVLIIDTAGRLQNKAELMAELEKIVRVLAKLDPDAPHTVLQTLDATTGQNALNQVEIFRNIAGVSGLIMTKLDGTARGGILVAIAAKHKLPVYFIGVGEGVDDLEPFEAEDFAKAIAGV